MPWYISPLFSLALFILVLSLPIQFRFQVEDDFSLQMRVGPFVILRLPKPEKPIDLRQFTYAKHQKRLAKEAAKQEKNAKIDKKKDGKRTLQKGVAEAKKKDNKIDETLHMVRTLFKVFPKLYGSLRCRIYRLVVVVGGDDAADVALHYGILSQSVACLLEYLDQSSHLLSQEPEDLVVRADFLAKKTTVQVDIGLEMRLGALMKVMGKGIGSSLPKS